MQIIREDMHQILPYDHESFDNDDRKVSKDLLIEEYQNNRASSISFFKTFEERQLKNTPSTIKTSYTLGLFPLFAVAMSSFI